MTAQMPCPVCGDPIQQLGIDQHDFDCPSLCRLRNPTGWQDARAQQITREIQVLLAEHRTRPDQR